MGQIQLDDLKQLVSESTRKIQNLHSKQEINAVVETLVTQVMDSEYASLWVFQRETASLIRAREDDSTNEISMLGQHGVLAKCFFTLSSGIFNYLASEKEYLPDVDNPDNIKIKSKIIVPIVDGENFLGIITAYSSIKKIKNFSQDDLELLETLVPFLINVIYVMYPELKGQEEEVYINERLIESSQDLVDKVGAIQQQQQHTEGSDETLNFLANTVHDIRTPANSLYGFLELLEEQLDDPRLLQYLHNAKESAFFINDLTTSILDRISSQRARPDEEITEVNPTRFFADIAESFSANMYNKGLTYNIYIDPALPKGIKTEQTILKRTLMNLLNNAYKFTPSGREVSLLVQYKPKDKKIKVSVTDTGIGIAPEKQEEIFHAFTQAEDDTKETYGGTGLGLTICAEYVDKLGGKLKLKSELEKGSTFYFSIPVEVTDAETLFQPIKNRQLKVSILLDKKNIPSTRNIARYLIAMGIEKSQIQTFQNIHTIPDQVTHLICFQDKLTDTILAEAKQKNIPLLIIEEKFLSLLEQPDDHSSVISQYGYYAKDLYESINGNQPLRKLVADDDKINLELIKAILAEEFCQIDTVTDGKAAVEMLQKSVKEGMPYQIVYLDKHMPILSGPDVIALYRQEEKTKGAPRIFAVSISGDGKPDESNKQLFDMHVGKPFNKKAIKETLSLAKTLT
jgi:signal transduction histidine kinase/CheY-like chemotaxis protein